jgi:dTDP-4-dehydrorhamnose 3,5-epimerase-like enzyme
LASHNLATEIPLSRFNDDRGQLTILEASDIVPFRIARLYWITEVPKNQIRANHGHKELEQVFICLKGEFSLFVSDGNQEEIFDLSQKSGAFYVPKAMWRKLMNFTEDSVCLVLASRSYQSDDYIKTFEEFKYWKSNL